MNILTYNLKIYVNNELAYEEKNMTCNDEQFETFIKLLNYKIRKLVSNMKEYTITVYNENTNIFNYVYYYITML